MEQFANNPSTTLGAAISSTTATSITVASGTGFPSSGNFRILIDSEILEVTAVSGTTWTVVRGDGGTTAATHSNGAAVTGVLTKEALLALATLTYPYGNFNYGRPYLAKTENVSVAASATTTLMDTTGGSPSAGYIDHIWIGVNDASSTVGRESSLLNIYIDGEGSPSFVIPLGSLFMAFWGPNFTSRYMGFVTSGDSGSGFCALKIPFSSSVKVTLTNGDGSNGVSVYSDISYKLTTNPVNWGLAKHLYANYAINQSCTPYSTQTLLNISGTGLFYGLLMQFNGADGNYHYLEGNFKIYIDGESTASLEWSGTEDYFLQGSYFSEGVLIADTVGCTTRNGSEQVSAYRFHLDDPIPFTTSIKVTWNCGDASEATVSSNVALWFAALYYLNG